MSGVFYEGEWFENIGRVCNRCGNPVYKSTLPQYSYQCFHHDEDLFTFEVSEATTLPRVMVARPVDSITINTALEYILDATEEIRMFDNQPDAEVYLLSQGIPSEDLQFLHFIDCDGVPDEPKGVGTTEHFIVDFGDEAGTCTVHKDEMTHYNLTEE